MNRNSKHLREGSEMRTQIMIGLIVAILVLVDAMALVGLVVWLGSVGLVVGIACMLLLVVFYLFVVKPWHLRWGATEAEVAMTMPGDDLLPDAKAATRAITINATPEAVWPWLVQLGYGKAGWYSYDWIDNDFQPSARQIIPEFQRLEVGDSILMMPSMGFEVRAIDQPRAIVSMLQDGSTSWCLGLYPTGDGATRLVSRWRPNFDITPGTLFMIALSEPGTFVMEQKMLRNIRNRVEKNRQAAS